MESGKFWKLLFTRCAPTCEIIQDNDLSIIIGEFGRAAVQIGQFKIIGLIANICMFAFCYHTISEKAEHAYDKNQHEWLNYPLVHWTSSTSYFSICFKNSISFWILPCFLSIIKI